MWFLLREIRDTKFDSYTNEKAIDTVREGFEPSIIIQPLSYLRYEGRKYNDDMIDGLDVVGFVVGKDGLVTSPARHQKLDRLLH